MKLSDFNPMSPDNDPVHSKVKASVGGAAGGVGLGVVLTNLILAWLPEVSGEVVVAIYTLVTSAMSAATAFIAGYLKTELVHEKNRIE